MEEDQLPPSSQPGSSLVKSWGPAAAVAAMILIFSSIPGTAFPQHPDKYNSVVHFLEFGLLGYFLIKALASGSAMGNLALIAASTVACAMFGFLDEAHQFLVPYRMFDTMDLIFDTAGSLTGGIVFLQASFWARNKGGT